MVIQLHNLLSAVNDPFQVLISRLHVADVL